MNLKDKQQNVVNMIKTLGQMGNEITDKTLSADFSRFLTVFITSSTSLVNLMQVVDKKISNAKLSKNTTADGMTNKATADFWVKVRDIIMKVYELNRGDTNG